MGQLTSRDRVKVGSCPGVAGAIRSMLLQGEEWDATARFQFFFFFVDFHTNPGLARAVADGRRREFAAFGWKLEQVPDPRSRETFLRSKLDWDEISAPVHADMLTWYRDLIALRRRLPIFTDGQREAIATRFDEQDKWLAIERGPVTIVVNLADQTRRVPVVPPRSRDVLIASSREIQVDAEAISLAGNSVVVLGPGDAAT